MFKKYSLAGAALAASLIASTSYAATFTYDVLDNDPNNIFSGAPLVLDVALPGNPGSQPVNRGRWFSFEQSGADVSLTYDDVAGTAVISGTAVEILETGGFSSPFALLYSMTDVTNVAFGEFIDNTGAGSGSLMNGTETIDLGAKDDAGDYFVFTTASNAGNTFGGDVKGSGWVDPTSPFGELNDFLFTANLTSVVNVPVVPLPAAGWMLVSALAGMAALRRRKTVG